MRPDYYARLVRLTLQGVICSFDGVRVDRQSVIERGARLAHHAELLDTRVARYTSIGRYSKCHYADIGPFCSIAWDSTIGATGHPLDRASTHAFAYRPEIGGFIDRALTVDRPRVRLAADVWVGAHVLILPGVQIGAGAVLGAGAIVTRDIAPYSVVVGSPAQHIRFRIPEALIPRMLHLRWWDWPRHMLRQAAPLFQQELTASVVESLESHYSASGMAGGVASEARNGGDASVDGQGQTE